MEVSSLYNRGVFRPPIKIAMYVFKNVKSVQWLLLLLFTFFIGKRGLIAVSMHWNITEIKESLLNYGIFSKVYANIPFFFPPGDLKVQIIVFNAETDQHIYAHIYLFILSIIFNNYFFISKK